MRWNMPLAQLRRKRISRDTNSGKCEPAATYSAAVTMTPFCPASTTPVRSPLEPLALSTRRADVCTWLQAVLLALLAWAALLCAGLGSAVGLAPQSLASKLAANAQHLQRHGTSLASRVVRRDQSTVLALQIAENSQAVVLEHADAAPPAGEIPPRIEAQRAAESTISVTERRLTPRNQLISARFA